ncbi:Cysteinyl-tRNA synthetase [Hordeum vulgare]|nr:Cysteinyl-tRNA synthetase [Hordeum vulgare]
MVLGKITTYAMLTPECRSQIEEEIQAKRATCIAICLPQHFLEPEKEEGEGEQQPEAMEVTDLEEDEADQPATGFNMAEVEAEFIVAQAEEMAEQEAILESSQDKAYVEANRHFLQQK